MTNNQRIIKILDKVQRNAGAISVPCVVDGEWRAVSLVDLPAHLAIEHTCKIVRDVLREEDEAKARIRARLSG